jgi:hypothetical protein
MQISYVVASDVSEVNLLKVTHLFYNSSQHRNGYHPHVACIRKLLLLLLLLLCCILYSLSSFAPW